MLAPSYSPPELMKLSQTKAVGTFYQHNCGIGHIDADFDDRGGDQKIDLAAR